LNLEKILQKLQEYSLKASLNKCEFFCPQVTFLGFDITQYGLKMNFKKLNTINNWPYPTNLKELRCFLGFTNFYRRFIPAFLAVAEPLTLLTKGEVGESVAWKTDQSVLAFQEIKLLFFKEPLLMHFDFEKPRFVHVDSSGYGIAAVLSHPDSKGNLKPVSYYSQKLTDREQSWMIFDLELLAIVEACEEWQVWLMGTTEPIKMFSDRSNLLYFKTAKYLSPKQAWWALFLDNFNMVIYHVSGVKNPADAPSRREDFMGDEDIVLESHVIRDKLADTLLAEVTLGENEHQFCGYDDLSFQRPSKDLLTYFDKHYSPSELVLKEIKIINGIQWLQGRVFVPERLCL
jgi:hypothetical protein